MAIQHARMSPSTMGPQWRRTVPRVSQLLGILCTAVLVAAACTPDIGGDPYPQIMQFDLTKEPPLSPEPSLAVINPQTGLIDFGVTGLDIPDSCQDQQLMPVAECEFNQYLESLDGFPTVSPLRAPASKPLDLATVTVPDNLVIMTGSGAKLTADQLQIGFDATANYLTMQPKVGFPVGETVIAAVRGYDNGVKTADGERVVSSSINFLMRQTESLTCGAASAEQIDLSCKYLKLVAGGEDPQGFVESLFQLESLRGALSSAWAAMETAGGIPRDEVAILWAFPIHSAPVAELHPGLGMLPEVDKAANRIKVKVNGSIDASTLSPFTLANPTGTVFLLNLTALDEGDMAGGLPQFQVNYEAPYIVLQSSAALTDGDLYAIILTNKITDADKESSLVPSPVTVMLRATGAVYSEAEGKSNIANVPDADAKDLEAGRQQLAALLDNPLFSQLTGLTRPDLAYIYAFPYPDPTSQ